MLVQMKAYEYESVHDSFITYRICNGPVCRVVAGVVHHTCTRGFTFTAVSIRYSRVLRMRARVLCLRMFFGRW